MGSAFLSRPVAPSWSRLQDVLRARSQSGSPHKMVFFSLDGTSGPREVSYPALYRLATENSGMIRSLDGFAEGAPVLLHLDDQWDTILWFWSVLLAGGLPVLSSPFSNVDEHRRQHTRGLSTLLESPICITRTRSLPLFDGKHSFTMHSVESLSSRRQGAGEEVVGAPAGRDDDLAMLMLTSGSTGNAKAVCLTHSQIMAAVEAKASVRPLTPGRPFLNWIGLDHVAGLVEIHIQAMLLDVDQIHVHAANVTAQPASFLDLLSRYRVSRSFAPNFFLAKLVSTMQQQGPPEGRPWDLSDLTVLASGGEVNDVKTCVDASALLERYGAPPNVITPGFGMTETCAGAIFNLNCPDYEVGKGLAVASLGRCMKGIEMRVTAPAAADGASRLARPNEAGELEVRGDVVFKRYYRNPKATAEAFTADGWFRTGDQALIDSDGNLCLMGRFKDVMNINGVKVASADIQASLEQSLGARVARVVAFPSKADYTEQITVAYIPKEWPMTAKDMADIEGLAVQACIMSGGPRPLVLFLSPASVSKLPMSALGKISRAKMRTLFEQGVFVDDVESHRQAVGDYKREQRQLGAATVVSDAEADLMNDFALTLNIELDTVGVETPIFELGCKSMDLIRLKHRMDTRLGIEVPIVMLMKYPTARLLAAALNLESAGGAAANLEETGVIAYDPVVVFRSTGSKTPLWLVHPGVGEVLVFIGLAQHLNDDDRPVYALRARGFEPGQQRFASIDETVEAYLKAIRSRQPEGPYALAGYSYGTMLAFEVSKRLNQIGGPGTVGFLGSFNLPPHIKKRMRHLNWNVCLLHLSYFLGLTTEEWTHGIETEEFRAKPRADALAQVMHKSDKERLYELGLDDQGLARWTEVAFGLQSMAVDYEPGGQVGVIDIFHAIPLKMAAGSREEWVNEHLSKWKDFCATAPKFHEVGGAHYTMIGPEHVVGFSNKLKAALRDRGL
ncbi:hypothetical protein CDD83_9539 [Cordyceps sp. RAO-2017]|nr:hypothetical protein CDD83_9539 [Cordyceps sp. RAO-2017]